MGHSKLNDEALIRLIARSQTGTLSALYDRYTRLVFGLAVNVVGDHSAAEEITLDVFTRIWEKARTYRAKQALVSTWLTSITRSRAIDELRRRQVRPDRHSVEWDEVPPVQITTAQPVTIPTAGSSLTASYLILLAVGGLAPVGGLGLILARRTR
jgi:DNA-directed RNA polymerase specialized sigma24 family protein